ncbi:hypothetical protein IW262DRAFT_247279 [Armillaria fumosa]|nr:hypothetical protein IW262DRAFT_247279 [Armillaria fumosa]
MLRHPCFIREEVYSFTLWIRLPLSSLLGTFFCTAWSSIQLLDEYPTPRSLSVAICTEIGRTQPSAIHLTRTYTEFCITDIVHVRRSQANYPSWELLASKFLVRKVHLHCGTCHVAIFLFPKGRKLTLKLSDTYLSFGHLPTNGFFLLALSTIMCSCLVLSVETPLWSVSGTGHAVHGFWCCSIAR